MGRSGRPPVPPRGVLSDGRRRLRSGRLLALAALVLAPASVAVVAWLAVGADDHSPPPGNVAAAATPAPPRSVRPAPAQAPEVELSPVDAFFVDLRKPPRAALVFDVGSGEVLWHRRPLRVVPIASLTKIMTAIVVTERARPREPVRITAAALRYQGSGVGLLPRGRRVRLETLLNGLMLVSGNDAAIALAGHVSGTERRFVRLMNRRARDLGLRCTRFASSHGLEDGNRSCARDLAVLTRVAMKRPRIRRIVRRREASFKFPVKGGRLYLYGHNPLIRAGYAGAIGLKTGYTDAAGSCFVGVVRRGGRALGVVLLNSRNVPLHSQRLLDAAFRG